MATSARNLVILGSTGSIGRSTLEVVRFSEGALRPWALTAHQSFELLCQQATQFQVPYVVATDPVAARSWDWSLLPPCTKLLVGSDAVREVVAAAEVDMVVAAMVGSAGLAGTWAALDAGKPVALANKESLVMAGPLVMQLAAERGVPILPVDSEHSAIFQVLQAGRRDDLARIILTASGGPFRKYTLAEMHQVSVEQALSHPTWRMGKKISIDSATMMNKALEMIEARWLFDLPADQIDVVVHPQSIIHSMVEFRDGSMLAQMSPPDMKLPIQTALTWPSRLPSPARKMDLSQAWKLDFEPPDEERFPALALGREVAAAGGTAGCVLNAANEAAVASFLAKELSFMEIVPATRAVLANHSFESQPTLERLSELDTWARQEVSRWICH